VRLTQALERMETSAETVVSTLMTSRTSQRCVDSRDVAL